MVFWEKFGIEQEVIWYPLQNLAAVAALLLPLSRTSYESGPLLGS